MKNTSNYISDSVEDNLEPLTSESYLDPNAALKERMRKKLEEEVNIFAQRSKEIMGEEWAKKWE